MLYKLFRFLFRLTNKFYFKSFQIKGSENIPSDGPVFFVANHPSAFMDPIVIATAIDRPLYFLGKGVLFNNKILKRLLPHFNVIPIFRSHETPELAHKNRDVFSQCYKHFAKGKALLVFPEGISLTERKIKKIQSGAARIALGAEAENNFSLNIKIVTIGLNFSDPHQFQSDLFVNIDEPIYVSDYYELYKQDSFKAAHALTDEIRRRIEKQVVAIQDAGVDKLVSNIEVIFKAQILKDLGMSPKEMANDFYVTKSINDSVNYFMEHEPARVARLEGEINSYMLDLKNLSLKDTTVKGSDKSSPIINAFGSLLFLILGLPLFVFGFLNNILAYRIPYWAAKAIAKEKEFHGAIAFTMGTFTFLLFYSVQIYFANKYLVDWRLVLAYAIMLPISGLFAFFYFKKIQAIQENWRFVSLFLKKTSLASSLIEKRLSIINGLEKARAEYVNYRDNGVNLYTKQEII